MQLADKTAIITGGAVRLGRALALALAEEGVKIVLHYHHSKDAAQVTAREIRERGVAVELVQADFTDSEAAARQVMERAIAAFGRVEFLINNAAIFGDMEIGFLTNPGEAGELFLSTRRDAIADALARAVVEFGRRYNERRGVSARLSALRSGQ